jgi:hypothetical protein
MFLLFASCVLLFGASLFLQDMILNLSIYRDDRRRKRGQARQASAVARVELAWPLHTPPPTTALSRREWAEVMAGLPAAPKGAEEH